MTLLDDPKYRSAVYDEFKITSHYYSLPFNIIENNFHMRLIIKYYYNRDYEKTMIHFTYT